MPMSYLGASFLIGNDKTIYKKEIELGTSVDWRSTKISKTNEGNKSIQDSD